MSETKKEWTVNDCTQQKEQLLKQLDLERKMHQETIQTANKRFNENEQLYKQLEEKDKEAEEREGTELSLRGRLFKEIETKDKEIAMLKSELDRLKELYKVT